MTKTKTRKKQMFYSIGQVSKKFNLSPHTLRYYDKLGLFPKVGKSSSGLRRFSEEDLSWLGIIECLKATGLTLKGIKHYLDLAERGNQTISERKQIMLKQKAQVEQEIKALKQNLQKLNFKIKYYELAEKLGEENVYQQNPEMLTERDRLFNKTAA